METSIFIAKILGLAYLSIGLGMVLNQKYYQKSFEDMIKSPGFMYLGGMMALIAGFLMVTYHNIWVKEWYVVISVFGWIALVKGVLLLAFPKAMLDFSKGMMKKKNFSAIGIFALALGLFFGYCGFFI